MDALASELGVFFGRAEDRFKKERQRKVTETSPSTETETEQAASEGCFGSQ